MCVCISVCSLSEPHSLVLTDDRTSFFGQMRNAVQAVVKPIARAATDATTMIVNGVCSAKLKIMGKSTDICILIDA